MTSIDLLRAVIHPDSDDVDSPLGNGADGVYDRVEYKYNRLGEVKEIKDQLASVRTLDYDKLGRLQHDRVTTLAGGVDGAVRRLTRSYEVRGLLEKVTNYDNADPASGNPVNEVQYAYDNFSQLTTEYQSHSGAVNTSTSPKVQYAYANGSANHTRLTSLTYPDGRVTTVDYGSANLADDLLSRVFRLKHGSTIMAEYSRLGLNEIVRVDNPPSPGVELTYIKQGAEPDGDAGDKYAGLDRFGRVVDQRWLKTSDGTHRERVKYGYDRANNREWRQNVVAGGGQDEFYTYDGLYQLKTLKRGTLNGNPPATPHTGISGTPSWEEQFNYDPTGNWNGASTGYKTLANGSTTLDQNRAHNKANEVTDISETVGTAWPTPTQNAVGNVTVMPQPASLGSSYDAKYDAWNRLVEVKITAGAVQGTYAYDGLHRRVSKTVSGTTRHFYFSGAWQILEERIGSSSTADRQFVWGQRHLDDLVLRDKGSERLYVLHDFFHPTAVMVSSTVQERYGYDAFGTPRYMDGSFGSRSSSNYGWETLFAAYRYDLESGVYQVRHRYLHPKLGPWVSRDPIDYEGGINLYGYVSNNSANLIDPYGRFALGPVLILAALGVVVVGAVFAAYELNRSEGAYGLTFPGIPITAFGRRNYGRLSRMGRAVIYNHEILHQAQPISYCRNLQKAEFEAYLGQIADVRLALHLPGLTQKELEDLRKLGGEAIDQLDRNPYAINNPAVQRIIEFLQKDPIFRGTPVVPVGPKP